MRNLQIKSRLSLLWKKGAFHILGGSFFNKFISMFAAIIIVRVLSKDEYGLLSYVENIYNYAFIFAGLGLGNSILRFVVLENDIKKKKGYFDFAIKYGIYINLVLIMIVITINTFVSHGIEFSSAKGMLYIYILILPFQHLLDDFLLLERAMYANSRYAYFSFSILCTLLITRVLGAYINGVWGVIYFILIAYIILTFLFFYNLKKKYFEEVEAIKLNKQEIKNTFIYSVQYMITNGLWTLFILNGTFLLSQLSNSRTELADLKVAMVLPGCLGIVSGAIGTYVAPYFIKHEEDKHWIWKSFLKVCFITFVVLTMLSICCLILEKFIITLIYGEEYLTILPVMNLLLISAIINGSLRYTIANILAAVGLIKYNLIASVIGIICQFIFSFLLVPSLKATGTAITEIIVYSIMSLVLFILFRKRFREARVN